MKPLPDRDKQVRFSVEMTALVSIVSRACLDYGWGQWVSLSSGKRADTWDIHMSTVKTQTGDQNLKGQS